MYTKYINKFEMGKKLEIAVCNVQKMEKIQKKARPMVNNTAIFINLFKKFFRQWHHTRRRILTRF